MLVLESTMFMPDPSEVFRPETVSQKSNWSFRTYESEPENLTMKMVKNTYLEMHTNQTVDFVNRKISEWGKFDKFKMSLLDALDLLNSLVDESDPDIGLPNAVHAYQTAERIRQVHPEKDWMHLVGLIHDLGKVMALYGEPQWAVVGDTFPVGCAVAPSVVLRDCTFAGNPDLKDPRYNTTNGIYQPNCGLSNVTMSWGHDEYMYRVLKHHGCSLPKDGLNIIRYHSFYPWHTSGDYQHLLSQEDKEMLPWIKEFNKFDLYTKKDEIPDMETLRPYYQSLVDKYCPGEVSF